jgi:hypothetical protein
VGSASPATPRSRHLRLRRARQHHHRPTQHREISQLLLRLQSRAPARAARQPARRRHPDHAGADVILNAIKSGNSFCSIDSLYPADGFTQVVTAPSTTATNSPGHTNAAGQPKAATENSKAISVGAETPLFAAGPGQSIPWSPTAVLHIKTPPAAGQPTLRVLRDGQEIANQQTNTLDLPLPGPGHYRTEAYLQQPGLTGGHRWTLWIFANPVYVTAPKN